MSLLDKDSKFPRNTLRSHTSPITSLEFVKIPISTTKKTITLQNDSNSMILKPFLLSSDETGKLLLWDLTILRPVRQLQAHNSQILTIRQLGIRDDVVDSNYFGLVLTHGRDHSIKFWRLFNENGTIELVEVSELPVNALNFSNVDVFDDLLITPNTMNSNAFDIYDVNFISQQDKLDETKLKRLFEACDVYQVAVDTKFSKFDEFNVQRENTDDGVDRVDKFGIIMKLLFVSNDIVFIGYESGHVASIRLNFQSKTFEILTITNHHFPNPVLSLTYDRFNSTVLSTSVDFNLVVHDINARSSNVIKVENFGKISGVCCLEDRYVLSSWNGYIRFYKLNSDKSDLVYLSNFKKPKGLLAGDLNVIGNINDDAGLSKDKGKIVKPNSLALTAKKEIDESFKKLLNRRDVKVIENSYLAVGYDDGTITLYNDL